MENNKFTKKNIWFHNKNRTNTFHWERENNIKLVYFILNNNMYLICNNLHLNIKVTYSICLLTNKINVHSLRENQQHEPTIKFKHLAKSQFGISYALLFYRYERCEFPKQIQSHRRCHKMDWINWFIQCQQWAYNKEHWNRNMLHFCSHLLKLTERRRNCVF